MKKASEPVIEVADILEECSQLRCVHGTPFDPVPDTVPPRVHFRRIIDKLWFHLIENTTEGPFGNLDLLELLICDGQIQAIVTAEFGRAGEKLLQVRQGALHNRRVWHVELRRILEEANGSCPKVEAQVFPFQLASQHITFAPKFLRRRYQYKALDTTVEQLDGQGNEPGDRCDLTHGRSHSLLRTSTWPKQRVSKAD
jgi:hypothetical protein